MRKSKYTVMCTVFFILLLLTIAIAGCESKGVQGFIYHDKELIATTVCEDALFLKINPDTIVVRCVYDAMGMYNNKEIYKYLNDGKYHVERKECTK